MTRLLTVLVVLGIHATVVSAQLSELDLPLEPGARAGSGLAASHGRVAVGAPGFQRRGHVWVLEGETRVGVAPPVGDDVSEFGRHLGLSDRYLAISAVLEDQSGVPPLAVYIYRRNGAAWRLERRLMNPAPRVNDGYGQALVFRNDSLFVGALGADGSVRHDGAVFIYRRNRGNWDPVGLLLAPAGRPLMRFGEVLAGDARTLVVGAPKTGAAFVFKTGDSPDQVLSPPDQSSTGFARALALGDSILVVGAIDAGVNDEHSGVVHVFALDSSNLWKLEASLKHARASPGDLFGASVAEARDLLFVGAPFEDGLHRDTGALHIFRRRRGDRWVEVAQLERPGESGGDRFGERIAVDRNHLYVSAPGTRGESGRVYSLALDAIDQLEKGRFRALATPQAARITAMVHGPFGYIWYGSLHGLYRFDGYDHTVYRHDPSDSTSLSNAVILRILNDKSERLWIGTEDGLNLFEPSTNSFRRMVLPADSGYPTQPVVALYEDKLGRIWTGTNGRLYVLGADAESYREFKPFTGPPETVGESYVSGIAGDANGYLWVLAKDLWAPRASLYRVDTLAHDVQRVPLSKSWGQVGPLFVDSSNGIWIKGPAPISLDASLPDSLYPPGPVISFSHWSYHETPDKTVWVGTMGGLLERANQGAWRLRQVTPGVPNAGANWVRHVGRYVSDKLLVGTDAGAFVLRLDDSEDTVSVPVALTHVDIVGPSGTRSLHGFGIERIVLRPGEVQLSFSYAALAFDAVERIRYRYRIEGLDAEWTEAADRRNGTYARIPSGDYRLRVQAAGAMTPTIEASVGLEVLPSFWQTSWFRILILGLVVGVFVAAHRLRLSRMVALERLRTQVASDLHDDLSSNLSAIALAADVVRRQANLTDAHAGHLERASETARSMTDRVRDLVWFIAPDNDSLEDLVLRITDTVAMLLPDVAYTMDVELSDAQRRLPLAVRREVYLLVKEALHNASRHSEAGNVSVRIRDEGGSLLIVVSDDGRGFDVEKRSAGLGLASMQRRAVAVNAQLQIDSVPGGGTRIFLRAPFR